MDLPRTRDCIALVTDLAFPVEIDEVLATRGFVGGSCCRWIPTGSDTFRVTVSDGTYGGFFLWGSRESADNFSAYTQNQEVHRFATVGVGTWVISTVAYERYTLRSRLTPPLVEHVYEVGQRLKLSNRGLWYPAADGSDDEWNIVPNELGTENPYLVGMIVQRPTAENNFHLMVQTSL